MTSGRRSPFKTTPEFEALLLREAQRRVEGLKLKEIAAAIGSSRSYVQRRLYGLMDQVRREQRQAKAPRERQYIQSIR